MKELETKIINDLIDFYKDYIAKNKTNDEIKKEAKIIESKYLNTSTLVSEIITQAIGRLVDFYTSAGIKKPSKQEAKEIIKKLEERKKELSKDK